MTLPIEKFPQQLRTIHIGGYFPEYKRAPLIGVRHNVTSTNDRNQLHRIFASFSILLDRHVQPILALMLQRTHRRLPIYMITARVILRRLARRQAQSTRIEPPQTRHAPVVGHDWIGCAMYQQNR